MINELAGKHAFDTGYTNKYYEIAFESYKEGAEKMRELAFRWLTTHARDYVWFDDTGHCGIHPSFFSDFERAIGD